MPKQGQSVESCIIGSINKKKGDSVKKGDVLFSYETDKASFEEESPINGVVLECFYNEGDEVPVLENMMVIGEPGEKYEVPIQKNQEPRTESQDENPEAPSVAVEKGPAPHNSKLRTPNYKPSRQKPCFQRSGGYHRTYRFRPARAHYRKRRESRFGKSSEDDAAGEKNGFAGEPAAANRYRSGRNSPCCRFGAIV